METQCLNISNNLKESIKSFYYSQEITERLKSLRGMIIRISRTNLNSLWIERLLSSSNQFISELRNSNSQNIQVYMSNIENKVFSCLVTDLNIPSVFYQMIIDQIMNAQGRTLKLCELLTKFITEYLKLRFNQPSVAKGDFEQDAKVLFQSFHIPYNFYVIGLANVHFGNKYNYDLQYLENFLSLFFGSYQNYKFYVKIARCVDRIENKLKCDNFFPAEYDITLTVSNQDYKGNNRTIAQDQKFNIKPLGINSHSYRGDQLVIFGRHPGADIAFPPDDTSIDYAAFILINSDTNILAMDISKKQNCGIKIQNNTSFFINRGMLINIAKSQTFHIEEIKLESTSAPSGENAMTFEFNDDDNEQLDSNVIIECIEGTFKDYKFKFSTKTRDPNLKKISHIFGCGGGGIFLICLFQEIQV